MPLTFKEKELVNIGASVATGCKPCTDYHFKKVREAGASDEEITQAISYAMSVRDSAKEIMENHGLKQLGITKDKKDRREAVKTTRIKELVSVAAAFAVNCTTNLEKHMAASQTVGITKAEIESVLIAADFIKDEAAYYVDRMVKLKEKYDQLEQLHKELQQTQAQLVQSEKMAALGKLVAGVVHEMNTPIGTINSTTDVLNRSITNILKVLETSRSLDKMRDSRKLQESLEALQNNRPVTAAASDRLSKIISSLKSFARLDESTFQKTDLHEGLESILTLMEHDLKERIDVVKEYGDIPKIFCYPGDINQVFMNLLTNAAQAIQGKGTIKIRTFADNRNVHIEMTDTGVGITPGNMKYLFDPRFTKKGSRVKAGIGLFTSYNIVQNHKGQIKVESKVGKGSTFMVIIPRDLKEQLNVQEQAASDSQTPRCSRLKT